MIVVSLRCVDPLHLLDGPIKTVVIFGSPGGPVSRRVEPFEQVGLLGPDQAYRRLSIRGDRRSDWQLSRKLLAVGGSNVLYLSAALVGVIVGAAYSLMAVSLTLMYRSTGILSFAHAAFAMVAAYLYADFGSKGWPLPVAAAVATLVTVAYGLLVERLVIRRVRAANSTMKLIATLGVLQFTVALIVLAYGSDLGVPAEPLLPARNIEMFDILVSYQQLAVVGVSVIAAAALAAFLARTKFGLAVRAVPQNAESARLMGISPVDVSRFNWALGSLLAALTGVLVAPTTFVNVGTFPLLLLKALTACLFGGLVSLPLTFVGGLVVGVVESEFQLQFSAVGANSLGVLGLVVALLVFRKTWASEVPPEVVFPTSPGRIRRRLNEVGTATVTGLVEVIRPYRLMVFALAAFALLVLPTGSEYWAFVGARALFYVIQALSLVLLVGYSGQVSLMHGAYVGIGAFTVSFLVHGHGWPLEVAIPVAALAGVPMGALVGLPALRLSGLQFAIASLAFSGAAASWLFQQPQLSRQLPRGTLFGVDLFETRNLYLFMLPVTVAIYALVWNIRRSTYGALLLSARDSPSTVAHFGANPRRARMSAFLMASFIASLGGAFWGVLLTRFGAEMFSFGLSISLLLFTVLAGSQSLAAPVLVGLLFGVVPSLLQGEAGTEASAWPDLISGVLVVMVVASRPEGLASLLRRPRSAAAGSPHGMRDPVLARGRFARALVRPAPAVSHPNGHNGRRAEPATDAQQPIPTGSLP